MDQELKARLAQELCALFEGWTLYQAAARLRLWPSEVSGLRRGCYKGFSIDRLVRLIAAQGYDVELSLRPVVPKPAPRVAPTVVVKRYDRFGRPQ